MMKWFFPGNDGGRDSGIHDPGVETFKGNFDRYLAREIIQNSLDVRLDSKKPVHVTFDVVELERKLIPDIDSLSDTFARCAKFWKHSKKAHDFFLRAGKIANASKILALRIGDSNTTGVLGSETERDKGWYNLIRSSGSSSKQVGDEGGSFGIGKNAPFAASLMRTVLYSTYNTNSEYIFQGVATLASHELPSGLTAQATGFLGGKKGVSMRSKSEIPSMFVRTQRGTDIVVLGFPKADDWQNDLTNAVVEHFWPAIEWGDLVVSVGKEEICRKNLARLLERYSGEEDSTAHWYYRAYKNPTFNLKEDLPSLKHVNLYLSVGDNDMPKRVAMIRKTGMVIFAKQFRSLIPFCGAFVCRNETGNPILREMEPPRHDTWDPDHPEKGQNKRIESEYLHFIRECIRKLAPLDDSTTISIPGLNRFLPDDDDSPEDAFDEGEGSKGEGQERSPLPDKIPGKRIETRSAGMGVGGGKGGGHNHNGNRGGGGGRNHTGGDDDANPPIPIRYRTYATDVSLGTYSVTVQPEEKTNKKVKIAVWLVGDDQRSLAEIKSARLMNGMRIQVISGGLLGPVQLAGSAPLKIEVQLREPIPVAMEVTAHEA